MRGFFAVRKSRLDCAYSLAKARESFERQGFVHAVELQNNHWSILSVRRAQATEGWLQLPDGRFALLAGTLFYRNLCDRKALEQLQKDATTQDLDEDELWGSFAVLLVTRDGLQAFTDRCGTFHIFRDQGSEVLSSSFLALAEALPARTIDETGLYDYLFQEAPHGGGTIFREVALLPSDAALVCEGASTRYAERPVAQPQSLAGESLEDGAERCLTILRKRLSSISTHFRDRLDTALSGGFDSRLILALLREQGVTPALHVYGTETSDDVRVAKRIAAAEGLTLEVADKSRRQLPPETDYPALVERNFWAFDGYPNDGLFDNGSDLETRKGRAADGRLALNGGGGEIFRNFFYLPDGHYSARAIAYSFFSQYDPAVCTDRFSDAAYQASLAQRLAACVGTSTHGTSTHGTLSRDQVEYLYPYFRCRYWMGRNNSVNNRFGFAVTPFIEHAVVSSALRLPLRHKTMGRLQARMIEKIDPALAAYPSAYGYAFDRAPPWSYRLKYLASYLRPPWLRRYTHRLHRQPQLPQPLQPAYREAVVSEISILNRYVKVERIGNPGQLNRLLSAEYLLQWANAE